jgi:hypothetical protein
MKREECSTKFEFATPIFCRNKKHLNQPLSYILNGNKKDFVRKICHKMAMLTGVEQYVQIKIVYSNYIL